MATSASKSATRSLGGTPSPKARRRTAGFTLIEVLVAVAILAIAMAAVVKATTENSANASYLRDKTFASWIASNKLAEMQMGDAWGEGGQDTTRTFAGRKWPVHVEISEFPSEIVSPDEMREVEVRVYEPGNGGSIGIDKRSPLIRLHGAITNPNPQ